MNPPASLIAEWVDQAAVLLAWPDADSPFQPWLDAVEATYTAIARAVLERQTLITICRTEAVRQRVAGLLADCPEAAGRLRTVLLGYDDVWVRDTAPLTVESADGIRVLDFRFNAWGGKYAHAADARLAAGLHESGVLGTTPRVPVDFVLEGGSIEVDGAGTLMTTSRCLLNPNRNPGFDRAGIEDVLRSHLGAAKVLWLDHGHAEGDDTDAHIDTLARFCSADTIAYTACDRPEDPLYAGFQAMEQQLQGFTSAAGRPYRLVPLPVPAPIFSEEGDRLPATYANFLIVNGAVLVPVYGDAAADALALDRLAGCFPGRTIVPIDCVPLIRQYGSLHCMTMQFPKSLGVP